MGKLSRIELDVVSNEVYSRVVNEVNDKCLKIVNENVDFSLFKELREVELKKEKLESELSDFVNKVNNEFNIRISYNSVGRYGYKENKELFNIVGSVDYNVKRNIEKELILNGIDKGLSIFSNNINNFYSDYKVGYGVITGTTAENLIRVNLRNRVEGTDDNKVNFKKLLQLYIS